MKWREFFGTLVQVSLVTVWMFFMVFALGATAVWLLTTLREYFLP